MQGCPCSCMFLGPKYSNHSQRHHLDARARMPSGPSKRKLPADVRECLQVAPTTSFAKMRKLLKQQGHVENLSDLHNEFRDLFDVRTPYGPLLTILPLPLKTGGHFNWAVVAPAPLLWTLCDRCPKFRDMLQQSADTTGSSFWNLDG